MQTKPILNSALRKRIQAKREARQIADNTEKARRILNILSVHVIILNVVLAIAYVTIVL